MAIHYRYIRGIKHSQPAVRVSTGRPEGLAVLGHDTAVAAAEIGSVLCIPFLARELQKMHKSKCAKGLPVLSYLTLLDKYVLGCLFFIVLMATENFVVGSLAAWQQQNCEAHFV